MIYQALLFQYHEYLSSFTRTQMFSILHIASIDSLLSRSHDHNQDRPAFWTIFYSSPFLPQFTKRLFLLSPSQIRFVHRSASYVPTLPKPSSDGCLLKNIPSLRSGLQGLWYLDALVSSPRPWLGLRLVWLRSPPVLAPCSP